MLGFFRTHSRLFFPCGEPPDCVPASRFSLPAGWTILGCYQGRVVLHDGRHRLLIWDPVFGGKHYVLIPVRYTLFCDFSAVLLSDDDQDGANDRFRIVVAFMMYNDVVGMVYSSVTGAWSNQATATLAINQCYLPAPIHDWAKPGAVVGDVMYWLLKDNRILSLKMMDSDNVEQHAIMSVLDLKVPRVYKGNMRLRRTTDGELGIIAVMQFRLHLCAMETDSHGRNSWMLRMTYLLYRPLTSILLPPLMHYMLNGVTRMLFAEIIGADEEGTVVFLRRLDGIFMV